MIGIEHICDALDGTLNLQLVDGCFSIVRGAQILSEMCCFKGMISPVDSYKRWNEIIPSHSTALVFDNKLSMSSDGSEIVNTVPMQARGWLIYMSYPTIDDAGLEIDDADLNVIARITNIEGVSFDIPYYLFFTLLSNPVTTDVTKLINKLEIVNPNDFYVTASILLPIINKDGVGLNGDAIPVGC